LIRHTVGALADIDEAISYLAIRDERAAEALRLRFEAAITRLDRFPEIGRPGRIEATREWSDTDAPYIVAYRVVGSDIQVLAVRHSSRQWPEHFEDR
jgi:plasmid stabilization system protein ParE